MTERNTFLRSANDLGLAAWFGGSLMGAVGVNGAAREEGVTEVGTARIASVGWAKWAPVGAAAIGAHLMGGGGLLITNRDRVRSQSRVTANTVAKTLLTGAALAATAYTRLLGKKVDAASSEKEEETEQITEDIKEAVPVSPQQAQRQLVLMQWTVPALTAGLLVLNALHGEQQRPSQQTRAALRSTLSQLRRRK
ncbi:hypothetical protein ACIQVR_38250 [Streptomyces xanthochromogenes]|uniref:hypothetical protein n=1 Tax=Streptomyces xanthochromogenes TaxID=67384 RepID=UPI0037F3298F